MKRQRGFTLVELLVVIAIIALLISLLIPSLIKARMEALTVKCAANMQQIATAAREYAQDNNDSWPPYRGFRGYAIRINGYPTQLTYTDTQAALPAPQGLDSGVGGAYTDPTYGIVLQNVNPGTVLPTSSASGPFPQYETCGIGRLYQTGYVADLRCAFDPALSSDSPFAGGTATSANWGINTQFYSSYIFSPHAAYLPSIDDRAFGNSLLMVILRSGATPYPGVPILYNPYSTTDTLPAEKCLAIDIINNYAQMAHTLGTRTARVNVAFGDGHVSTVVVPPQVIQFLSQINGNANLATIAAANSNTSGIADGPFPTGGTFSPNWGFAWGMGATNLTTPGASVPPLPNPGTAAAPQQPYLDSYVDLFETLANGGNPSQLNGSQNPPPPNDQYWLYNNGNGRVTYILPN